MGAGDDFIVTSIVKKAYAKHGKPICVGDGRDIKWEEVFDHNPKFARTIEPDAVWVHNIMFDRPYIDYFKTTTERMSYRHTFHVEPGEIFFHPQELRHKQTDFVYIEPNTKGTFSGNKDWGFEKWQSVVNLLPGVRFIQGRGRLLEGVEQVETRTFRDACALLSRAKFFVGTDGGLHHASAALGLQAVVVWGGLVSPKILGYDTHINLHSGTSSCGSYGPCSHCKQALEWVKIEQVVNAIRSLADQKPSGDVSASSRVDQKNVA